MSVWLMILKVGAWKLLLSTNNEIQIKHRKRKLSTRRSGNLLTNPYKNLKCLRNVYDVHPTAKKNFSLIALHYGDTV